MASLIGLRLFERSVIARSFLVGENGDGSGAGTAEAARLPTAGEGSKAAREVEPRANGFGLSPPGVGDGGSSSSSPPHIGTLPNCAMVNVSEESIECRRDRLPGEGAGAIGGSTQSVE